MTSFGTKMVYYWLYNHMVIKNKYLQRFYAFLKTYQFCIYITCQW